MNHSGIWKSLQRFDEEHDHSLNSVHSDGGFLDRLTAQLVPMLLSHGTGHKPGTPAHPKPGTVGAVEIGADGDVRQILI